jgi:multimeric flavodoxin WrbA
MKVIVVNGSPRKNGGINATLKIVEKELTDNGISVEYINIGTKPISGCISCGSCKKTKQCAMGEDIVNESIEKIRGANGLLIAAPVYYGGIPGSLKCFLDRVFYAGGGYEYKVGAAIVCSRREGGIGTFHEINNYFNLSQIIIAPSKYWNSIHGNNEEEISQDLEGLQIVKTLVRNMAWLIKVINNSERRVIPDDEKHIRTNFIR